MKTFCRFIKLAIAVIPMLAFGQTKGAIKQAIEGQYALAQPTNDHKDLTAPGAVIDLIKDDLDLTTTALVVNDADGNPIYATEPTSTYKNGRFQRGGFSKFMAGPDHNLVAGEKCWLINVEVRDDGVILEFLSDPINGARFRGFVKYPFPKGRIPPADVVLQQIAETIKAEPIQKESAAPPPAVAAPVNTPSPMAPIPPPAPPVDAPALAPKSISLGQSKAQVASTFGPPTRMVTLPTKEIDFYQDMKVIFVKGKVVDVQ
jgi:hypothetical protein